MLAYMRANRTKTQYPNIYKVEDGHFHIRISLGRDPITGKYGKRSEEFYGTLKAARTRQAEMQAESSSQQVAVTGWTMNQLADEYFKHMANKLAPGTMRTDKGRWKILKDGLGPRKVRSVTTRDIDAIFDALMRTRDVKPQTINRYRSLLSAMFRKALAWGAASINPVAGTETLTPAHVNRKAVDEDAVLAVLKHWGETEPAKARFLWLAVSIGARRGELCGLQIGDFDPVLKQLTICRAVKEPEGGGVIIGDTKAHNTRTFAIDDMTVNIIQQQIDSLPLGFGTERFIFSNDGGRTPWKPGFMTLCVARVKRELGVSFTIHSLRRLNTTMRLRAGVSPAYVQMTGGWKNQTTMRANYFDHVDADVQDSHKALGTMKVLKGLRDTDDADESSPAPSKIHHLDQVQSSNF